MKRHPKRARPLWGVAKRRPVDYRPLFSAVRRIPSPRRILYFDVSGIDAQGVRRTERLEPTPDGSPVTTVGSFASDVRIVAVLEPKIPKRIPITIGFSDGPPEPRPGVLTFRTDGTTPTIPAGTVLVLPPVEVRL